MRMIRVEGRCIPICPIQEGIASVKTFLSGRLSLGHDTTILVGAKSSAGKDILLDALVKEYADEKLFQKIGQDDYYYGVGWIEKQQRLQPELNLDHPDAVERALIIEHLRLFKQGKPFVKPCYSFITGERTGTETIHPSKVMAWGGNWMLYASAVRKEGDLLIFMEASKHTRLIRRLLRDVKRTDMTPSEILANIIDVVEPMAERYVEPTKKYAQLIFVNELIPELECRRSGLFQQQLKFRACRDPESMRKIGAEHLSTARQKDFYYSCLDYDVRLTDETVRIRQEGSQFLFSNKGPKHGPESSQRAKFEFPISRQIAERFPPFYGMEISRVEKERTLYLLEGVIVSIDPGVIRWRDGRAERLGEFVEIRHVDQGAGDMDKLTMVAEKLSLSMADAIAESYANL